MNYYCYKEDFGMNKLNKKQTKTKRIFLSPKKKPKKKNQKGIQNKSVG